LSSDKSAGISYSSGLDKMLRCAAMETLGKCYHCGCLTLYPASNSRELHVHLCLHCGKTTHNHILTGSIMDIAIARSGEIRMCGRYVRRSDKQRITEHFHIHGPSVPDFGPSYNVAPQTFQPVIRLNRDTGEREIVLMRWGLVPYWSKDAKIGLRTINAKAETITTAPAFREAFKYRRCLVPADAFYEWQKIDAKVKQPFAIAMKDGTPYAFAGLWEKWKDRAAGEAELLTFTVITTDPNEIIEPLHDRMPVIIPERDYDRWLNVSDTERPPVDLLRPFDSDQMTAWRVARKVGNVRNDSPELVMHLIEEAGTRLGTELFD
jgi:putative SOS response-associated peptidase YedK